MALTKTGAGVGDVAGLARAGADVGRVRPVRHAADCRLDARDWETLAKRPTSAETVAAVLRLTLPSARAALDAARARIAQKVADGADRDASR